MSSVESKNVFPFDYPNPKAFLRWQWAMAWMFLGIWLSMQNWWGDTKLQYIYAAIKSTLALENAALCKRVFIYIQTCLFAALHVRLTEEPFDSERVILISKGKSSWSGVLSFISHQSFISWLWSETLLSWYEQQGNDATQYEQQGRDTALAVISEQLCQVVFDCCMLGWGILRYQSVSQGMQKHTKERCLWFCAVLCVSCSGNSVWIIAGGKVGISVGCNWTIPFGKELLCLPTFRPS